MDVELYDDARDFLREAGDVLAAEPVVGVVVATWAHRGAEDAASGVPAPTGRPYWFGTLRDADEVVGLAMRTAPVAPYPLFVLPMPDDAARALARVLHERGEPATAVNGALPAARVVAEEAARLAGGAVTVLQQTRLFELDRLTPPAAPPGHLRPATEDDAPLVLDWFRAFGDDAAEQAGRDARDSAPIMTFDLEEVRRRVRDRLVWLWDDGGPVHVTAHQPPAYGVGGIALVYTPREHRGRGYAAAAVAEVARRLREAGARPCLFTDRANPTSNRIYEAIGFRAVADMANLRVEPPGT